MHGAVTFQGCRPLLVDKGLTDNSVLIHYYRRGYPPGSRAPQPSSVAEQAADARMLLERLGIERAHVLGHSIGTLIAMQLALDAPETVRSLVLAEPTWVSRPELLLWFQGAIAPVVEAYSAGDSQTATDRMLRLIDGAQYHETLPSAKGGSRPAAALDQYFKVDLPAAVSWALEASGAARITQPTLILMGSATLDQFKTICEDLLSLLPHARRADVPGATHNVIASRPEIAARLIRDFILTVKL